MLRIRLDGYVGDGVGVLEIVMSLVCWLDSVAFT